MKQLPKKAWDSINGLKTLIGSILHAIWFGIYIYGEITKKYEIDGGLQLRGHGIIFILTGVGLVGKYQKNKETIHKTINKIIK